MDSDVFNEHSMDQTVLVLIRTSHLRTMARFIQQDVWQVFDLTMPGWQISDVAVQEKISEI
jgi:hypothetical protein